MVEWVTPMSPTNNFGVIAFSVHILNDIFLITPQDPGSWGNSDQHPDTSIYEPPSDAELIPPCQYDCDTFGLNMTVAAIDIDGRPTRTGWSFWMHIVPFPEPEDMSNVDIVVRHEGQGETYFPSGDAWEYASQNSGYIGVDVRMPTLEKPLYIGASLPNGKRLHWKTVAPLRNRLFANDDWGWESSDP